MTTVVDRGRLWWLVLRAQAQAWKAYPRRPDERRLLQERAEVLLQGTSRSDDPKRLARRQFVERRVTWRLAERYELVRHLRVDGLAHVDAAHARGRGAVIATVHGSWPLIIANLLAWRGRPVTAGVGARLLHKQTPRDHQVAGAIDELLAFGGSVAYAGTGAFGQLERAVQAGGFAWTAIDMPGSLRLSYLGKPANVGKAAFQIAWSNGAPVLPAFVRRRGLSGRVVVMPPLQPTDYVDFESFCAAVCTVVEQEVLAHLAAYDSAAVGALWPNGDAEGAVPNRAVWQRRVATEEFEDAVNEPGS